MITSYISVIQHTLMTRAGRILKKIFESLYSCHPLFPVQARVGSPPTAGSLPTGTASLPLIETAPPLSGCLSYTLTDGACCPRRCGPAGSGTQWPSFQLSRCLRKGHDTYSTVSGCRIINIQWLSNASPAVSSFTSRSQC